MFGRRPAAPEPALRTEIITGIPASEVERIRKDYEDSDALKVLIESEPDGTWKLTAIYVS